MLVKKITISADAISATELQGLLEKEMNAATFEVKKEGPGYRSVGNTFSDPQVVAAMFQFGGAVIAALIAVFGVIYTARKKEGKSGPTTVLHIHTHQVNPALRVVMEEVAGLTAEEISAKLKLDELEEKVAAVHYLDDE